MLTRLRRLWLIVTRRAVVGVTDDVRRVFLLCHDCGRVVPYYRLVRARTRAGERLGCKCGGQMVRPGSPSYLTGAAWVLWSLAWRKRIRQIANWDPRAPIRPGAA